MSEVVATVASAVVPAATMTATALVGRAQRRVAVVDVAWGLGFVLIAVVAGLVGTALDDGDPVRRWLLVAMVTIWGLRLAWHIRGKLSGHGEDPRYVKLMGGTLEQVGMARAVRKVFGIQGLAQWFVSVPVVAGVFLDVVWWPVVWVGVGLWVVGLFFEAVGDAQLAAYKRDPDRGPVLDTGLWRWTRHPNYFGDACVWWGLWLVGGLASGGLAGLLTVLAPVAMTYFLVFATGARLLESEMMKRPGYPEYAARTSMFLPLPPR